MLLPSVRRDTNIWELSIADTFPIRELVSRPDIPAVSTSSSSSSDPRSIFISLPLSIRSRTVSAGWVSRASGEDGSSSIEGRANKGEEGSWPSASWLSWSLGLRIGEMRGGEAQQRSLALGLDLALCWCSLWQLSWCGEQLRMGEQPSTNGLTVQEGTSTSRGTPCGVKVPGCFLSAKERGRIKRWECERTQPVQLSEKMSQHHDILSKRF